MAQEAAGGGMALHGGAFLVHAAQRDSRMRHLPAHIYADHLDQGLQSSLEHPATGLRANHGKIASNVPRWYWCLNQAKFISAILVFPI